jgi:hypothetical protein
MSNEKPFFHGKILALRNFTCCPSSVSSLIGTEQEKRKKGSLYMSDADSYRAFILNADTRALMQQLNLDLKDPLVSAQNLVHMLLMMQNPSPAMQRKLESGEIDPGQMIQQVSESINRALDVIDFYRGTLDGN